MPAGVKQSNGQKTCPRCGNGFTCGIQAGQPTCWCFDLPRVIPLEDAKGEGCLCPDCLRKWIEQVQQDKDGRSSLK